MNIAKYLPILFIFLKKNSQVHWYFILSLVSISFISTLFFISFLLLTVVLVCYSFCDFWGIKLDYLRSFLGFSGSSAGKESACNAGDPGLIPGSGRTAGEGIGYPLQYSWAHLMAQSVKNPLAMRETWVWSLGWEDPLEEGKGHPL